MENQVVKPIEEIMNEPDPNPPAQIIITYDQSVHIVADTESGRVIAERLREIYCIDS